MLLYGVTESRSREYEVRVWSHTLTRGRGGNENGSWRLDEWVDGTTEDGGRWDGAIFHTFYTQIIYTHTPYIYTHVNIHTHTHTHTHTCTHTCSQLLGARRVHNATT